ncbi:MAG: hypothetical protein ABR538_03325, partial [Candidatus Binatia bacterium]
MTNVPMLVVAAALAVLAAPLTPTALAQTGAPAADTAAMPAGTDAAPQYDCSRWPASVYDPVSGLCACPQGMWWNLRGDACLPRQHAAGEFCNTVWPGSSPFFVAGGGYRCVCAPPLLWDEHATACRAPLPSNDTDCQAEWPGTLPVLSPSGTEFECRCPGGLRWDEASRGCVQGAPVVAPTREFYGAEPTPPPSAPAFPRTSPPVPAPTGPGDGTYSAPGAPGTDSPPPTAGMEGAVRPPGPAGNGR